MSVKQRHSEQDAEKLMNQIAATTKHFTDFPWTNHSIAKEREPTEARRKTCPNLNFLFSYLIFLFSS